MEKLDEKTRSERTGVLAAGFGATACMWAIGYVCRMPPAAVPGWLLLPALVACVTGGGFVVGRFTAGGWKLGVLTGLLISALNVAILGSLLGGGAPNEIRPSAVWWLPGFVLFGAALGAAGATIGSVGRHEEPPRNWTEAFAWVAAGATLMLLAIGGLVTSNRAGLAVVDWPNTFGYNLFLFPLSRMSGGIYYEHAHRLFGSLVGLTTLVFALHVLRSDDRRGVRRCAIAALLLVAAQGALGGLRVTGYFTLSARAGDTAPNTYLAVAHGVAGQVFFALMAGLAVMVSTTWRDAAPVRTSSAGMERALCAALAGALVLQIVLGSIVRHLGAGVLIHAAVAVFVAALAVFCGARAWGLYGDIHAVRRTGTALMLFAGVQFMLGFASIIAAGAEAQGRRVDELRVLTTTAHQTFGAMFLACAVMLMLWHYRMLEQDELEPKPETL